MRKLLTVLFLISVVSACDKSADDANKGPSPEAVRDELAKIAPELDAAAADTGITFEAVLTEKNYSAALIPKGWTPSKFMPGEFEAPSDDKFVRPSSIAVSTNCDGTCTAKDWAEVAGRVNFDPKFFGGHEKVKDEKLENGRIAVYKSDKSILLQSALWKEGGNRYHTCNAHLAPEHFAALPAFERACTDFRPIDW